MSFLDVTVMKKGNQLVAGLYVKPTDTHQYFHASSFTFLTAKNQYFSVKPCVLTEFVLINAFFDKRCIELKVWLKERGYSDKLVRGQILTARKFPRSEVLNNQGV